MTYQIRLLCGDNPDAVVSFNKRYDGKKLKYHLDVKKAVDYIRTFRPGSYLVRVDCEDGAFASYVSDNIDVAIEKASNMVRAFR